MLCIHTTPHEVPRSILHMDVVVHIFTIAKISHTVLKTKLNIYISITLHSYRQIPI